MRPFYKHGTLLYTATTTQVLPQIFTMLMGVQSLCKQFSFIIGRQPCMPCIPLPASICHDFFDRTVPQDATVVWFSSANKNVKILSFILWDIINMPFWYTREQIFHNIRHQTMMVPVSVARRKVCGAYKTQAKMKLGTLASETYFSLAKIMPLI